MNASLAQLLSLPLRRRWLLALICLALSAVPLVGTLGYFSALLLAPLCSLLGVGIAADAMPSNAGSRGHDVIIETLRASRRELTWVLVTPLAILTVGQLWNRNCDYAGGLAWYLMGPGLSTGLGWTAGVWGSLLTNRPWRRRWLGAVPFVVCTAISLRRLYVHPVLFAYDPFWGYFSGALYDERVAVSATFGWFRLYNVAVAAASLWVLWRWLDWRREEPRRRRPLVATVLLGGLLAVGWHGDRFGFTTTLDSTRKTLSRTRETEHFVIYYAPGSETEREIDAVATEHEFAWDRLRQKLGRAPNYKVHSFVFASRGQKRAVFGAYRVEVSLPWKRQIYLHHQAFPHGALHHELAHAFGATFGDPIFGLSPAVGLIEGLANALAPRSLYGLDLHDQAAVLDRLDKRPTLRDIVGLGFWRHASSRAYTTMGSFCAWLMDTYGVERMTQLYRQGGGFEALYGSSLEHLEAEWLAFLRSRPVTSEEVAAMAQRFKRGAIFTRACAHRVANLREQARAALDRGRVDEAVSILERLCELEPAEFRHRERLAYTLASEKRYAQADATLSSAAEIEGLTDGAASSIAELRGDVALRRRLLSEAHAHYERALAYPLAASQRRALILKRLAASDPTAAADIIEYFALFDLGKSSGPSTIVRVAAAGHLASDPVHGAIGSYLLGHQLAAAERPDLALPYIRRAATTHEPTPPLPAADLAREARLLLVESLVLTGHHDDALRELERLASLTSVPGPDDTSLPLEHRSGDRLDYDLWRQRIRFFATYSHPNANAD
ncbi:MAG: hypothetical protein B7733_05485 [Myxococcales bacterium FL481]|nr:MAG: hypothetical protein B7733_05485 [Myxococcales bacterium FL481]